MSVPAYDEMFNALLQALRELGGSGSISEIEEVAAKNLNLSEKDLNIIHKGNRTQFSYRLAWTRNYLKRYGLLENSSRGVWALTLKGKEIKVVNQDEVNKYVKALDKKLEKISEKEKGAVEEANEEEAWKDKLLLAIQEMKPEAFERFCQRILRESGFIQVQVTGRSGDGGIDGTGIIRLAGLLSFHVIFQCKRYKGNVPSKEVRDFRGAMVGRADKGIFITTGSFTRDAKEEASRDGAPPIDLLDGEQLVQKVKELGLGVIVATEEIVEVDTDWFKSF